MESPHDFGFNLKIIRITPAFLHFNLKVMVNWRHKKKSFASDLKIADLYENGNELE